MADRNDIFHSLEQSVNWHRLRERTPDGASPEWTSLKHDFVNILMILAAEIQRLQTGLDRANHDRSALRSEVEALVDRLFDSEDGTLPKQERRITSYIDGKVGKLNAVALTILGSIITGLAVLFLSGGGR